MIMKKMFLYSNYHTSSFLMPDDKLIEFFKKTVLPYKILRCDLFNGIWDQSLNLKLLN